MKHQIQNILPFFLAFALLVGCARENPPEGGEGQGPASGTPQTEISQATEPNRSTIFAMDTVMDLAVYGDANLLAEAEETIRSLEAAFSVTEETSDLAAVNRNGSAEVGDDTLALLTRALSFCARTDRALDVTVYPVVRAWGFTTGEYRVPGDGELEELLRKVDYTAVSAEGNTVSVGEGMMLDFGSVAKGYTGDRVLALLRERGAASAILNLGGNVQTLGAKPDGSPWRVAITDPEGDGYAGVAEVVNKAVVTSGGYERYFVEDGTVYRHILDPATGRPVDNGLLSVTVVGEEGVLCDAFSTALFVMGAERAVEFWRESDDFEAILITEDGNISVTEGIADFFTPLGAYAGAEPTVIRR